MSIERRRLGYATDPCLARREASNGRLLGVGVVFVAAVASWFQLEGGVFDADGEVLADAVLELVEEFVGVAVLEALVFDDDVCGENW